MPVKGRSMSLRIGRSVPVIGMILAATVPLSNPSPAVAYWSLTTSATASTQTGTLAPPTGVSATQPDPTVATATISWSPPTTPSLSPTGYSVERQDGAQTEPACGTSPDTPVDATTCQDEGLLPGHTYTWVVTSHYRSWTTPSSPTSPLTLATVPVVVPVAVVSVTPSAGPVSGGTAITVSGSGFVPGAVLLVGGRPATGVQVVDAGTITAVTPRGQAGPVAVSVVNPDGATASLVGGFTYQVAPVVRRVSPREGPASGGTLVTISGRDFVPGALVRFGEALAVDVTVVDARTITARTPAHVPGRVSVTVSTPGGSDTLRNGFTYQAVAVPVTSSSAPSDTPSAAPSDTPAATVASEPALEAATTPQAPTPVETSPAEDSTPTEDSTATSTPEPGAPPLVEESPEPGPQG